LIRPLNVLVSEPPLPAAAVPIETDY
jgi:hypothetical protein